MTIENMFDTYWETVANMLGYPATKPTRPSKQSAIRLCDHPIRLEQEAFRRLHEALRDKGWSKRPRSNWKWRNKTPACQPASSEEIRLERAVSTGREDTWSCQMSTASGIQDGHPNKRRSIDLVRRIGSGHFAFIELKIDSDNPLYAAFELLAYAMAYLHARSAGASGRGKNKDEDKLDVMSAEKIDLVVLGPDDWYTYKHGRGNPVQVAYKLDWLTQAINHGLGELTGKPTMTFCFKKYSRCTIDGYLDIKNTADAISDWSGLTTVRDP